MSVKLVADGGEITVGARVAVYTYGVFNVVLPQGKELATDEYTDDGYKDGYVYRPRGVDKLGRFDIAFVRADVTIDTNAGYSNFEAVVDTAQRKVSEDVYFERDITGAGLGGWTPGKDYRVGDIVDVRVFNRVIPQPVTAITYTSTAEDPLGVRVHVGGQTIRDGELVEEQNRAVREAIAKESATRRAQNKQTASVASVARSTAESAQADASQALSEVRDKRGIIQGYVAQAEAAVAAGREHNAAAEKKLAESRTVLDGAVGKLAEAEKLLDQSDLTLEENRRLRDEVTKIRTGVEGLLGDAKASAAEVQARVAEAEDIRVQVAGLLEDASARVAEGKRLLADSQAERLAGEAARTDAVAAAERAAKLAGEAETALNSVRGEREQVAQILADVKSQKQAADKALTDAGGVLTQAKKAAVDAGTSKAEVDQLYRQVVDKHDEVLNLHQEMITAQADINSKQQVILAAHQEAIDLTAKGVRALAGSQAAMAGSLAYFEQCLEASNKAIEAVAEATELNTQAIKRLDEVARLHEEAIREQAEATKKLAQATETLSTAQGLIKQQTENNSKALAITNRAVRAHSGAIGGMAASISLLQESQEETQKATEQALSATQANANAIRVQEAVGRARDEAVTAATEVATGARAIALAAKYAAEMNAVEIANQKLWNTYQQQVNEYIEDIRIMRFTRHWSLARSQQRMWSGDIFNFIGEPKRDHPSTLQVPIKGKWKGVVTIQLFHGNGLSDANTVFIEDGKIISGPKYFGSETETFLDGGATMKIKSAIVLVYPDTLPGGGTPTVPKPPKLQEIPPIPAGLKPN